MDAGPGVTSRYDDPFGTDGDFGPAECAAIVIGRHDCGVPNNGRGLERDWYANVTTDDQITGLFAAFRFFARV